LRKEKVMKKYKNITKLINLLLEVLSGLKMARLQKIQGDMEEFSRKCSDATKNSHLFYAAVERRWFGTAEKIRARVGRSLSDFSYHLQKFKDFVNSDETRLPQPSDIFAELSQIEVELGEYHFDLKAKTISVITDPINMDSIPFGSFEIKLFLDEISKVYTESPYKVIALEPNPAGADSNVTHPHVSSERLCEGEGVVSIRTALEQGRLCDFFTIIVNILGTYNPDSPYVSLDDWEGASCYDCGYTISGEDCYYCQECDREYCAECSTYCRICDTTVCLGCAYECPECEHPICRQCTATCSECEAAVCKDCITEKGLCQNCEEQRKEKQDEDQKKEKSTKPETCPAVQSDSVVEVAVLS